MPRLILLVALLAAAHGTLAAADPIRASPSRPTSLAITKFSGVDYVAVSDAARTLGLHGAWLNLRSKYVLSDANHELVLLPNSRDSKLDGLRLFLGEPTLIRFGQLYVSQIDLERALTPRLRPALGGAVPSAVRKIAIDAGHGGSDPGTQNPKLGLQEKVLTLDVALRLRQLLAEAGYETVMTRTDDRALELSQRSAIANAARADLFVSVHFNQAGATVSGTEIYTFAPQFQRSVDSWGPLSPHDDEKTAATVNKYDFWSATLSQAVQRSLLASLPSVDRGAKIKHLGALRNLDCPGVLVESAFLSNEAEARRVADADYRQKLAQAIADGIRAYTATLDTLRKPGKSN